VSKIEFFFSFSESAIKLIESYLMGQSQCVFANGVLSSFLPVTQGVLQWSILRPLLFSLLINDISNCIKFSNYHIYADDVQSVSKESITSVINQINSDLASVSHWSTENGHKLTKNTSYGNSSKIVLKYTFGQDWRHHLSVLHEL
jgi:Reverse transcriptase (RNA-dependent DNA polymerase)